MSDISWDILFLAEFGRKLDAEAVAAFEASFDHRFPRRGVDAGWGVSELKDAIYSLSERRRKGGPQARREPVDAGMLATEIIGARFRSGQARAEVMPKEDCAICYGNGFVLLWPTLGETVTPEEIATAVSMSAPCPCSDGERRYRLPFYVGLTEPQRNRIRKQARLGVAQQASYTRECMRRYPDHRTAARQLTDQIESEAVLTKDVPAKNLTGEIA